MEKNNKAYPTREERCMKQFLEQNPSVSFLLAKQKVIELMKRGTMDKALECATESFPPFAGMDVRVIV